MGMGQTPAWSNRTDMAIDRFSSEHISASRVWKPCRGTGWMMAVLAPLMGLSGCGYTDSRAAHRAQMTMIGIDSQDVQTCVGIPDKIKKISDNVQIFEYSRTLNIPSTNDSALFPLQSLVNLTETALGGAGKTCITDIRFENDRVTDVHYSGDDDEIIGTDGVCSIVTRGCVRQPLASMKHVRKGPFGPVSGFYSPKATPRPATEPVLTPTAPVVPAVTTTPATPAAK
ncbi:hypothetical protein SXCC_01438 [Gluconacetobacter sp. SXCC-1]|nr:hypothetical protein CT154_00105 [Komagataeibacter xylinus]EGG78043.1 hypothetical protein SXCC_01438 [Gluconacetobacter sp. SXCC-1]